MNKLKQQPTYQRQKDDTLRIYVRKVVQENKSNSDLLGKKREPEPNSQSLPQDPMDEYRVTPTVRLSDLGGISDIKSKILEIVELPIKHWDLYKKLNTGYSKSFLLSGTPGTGKSTIALSIGGELNIPFYQVIAPQLVSSLSGESENKIRRLFNRVRETAPSILFIDEIDSIISKRDGPSKDMELRIIAQLKSCINTFSQGELAGPVFIIGATNRPESIDISFRRSGIFDLEIEVPFPTEKSREEMLLGIIQREKIPINMKDNPFCEIAKRTNGYVASDLQALISQAGKSAVQRIISIRSNTNNMPNGSNGGLTAISDTKNDEKTIDLIENKTEGKEISEQIEEHSEDNYDDICIEYEDFLEGIKTIIPSNKREGFTTIPNVTWKDIGGLKELREELMYSIVKPITNPEIYQKVRITTASGILLYGPPGCGKTLLAKAVANEAKTNFISVKGPELLNKYVGESEKAIRELFKRARYSQPCVIFFDEFDSIAPKRTGENNGSSDRIVNQLLTMMDGVEERKQVYIIAATNRPDMIDDAMLREGRLGKQLYVPLPSKEDRLDILRTLMREVRYDCGLERISEITDHYSGADLAGLVRESKVNCLKRLNYDIANEEDIVILQEDFDKSINQVRSSIDLENIKHYYNFYKGKTRLKNP